MSVGALINAQLPALIGKQVVAAGNNVSVQHGQSTSIRFDLEEAASEVSIKIKDASGNPVHSLNLGPRSGGTNEFQWDGLDENGNLVPEGTYEIEVYAKNETGTIRSTARLVGIVEGLDFSRGYAELVIGDARIVPSDISEVRDPE